MNKAEEWLRKKLPETESLVNGYYETGYDELSKLLTDFANEMCKEQREICARAVLLTEDEGGEDIIDKDSIRNAPEPNERSDE